MGLGLLYGSPRTYLSSYWYATGDRLAYWIEHEVPSYPGNIPVKYTEALLETFVKHHVPVAIVQDAFAKLEKRGTRFDWPIQRIQFSRIAPPPPAGRTGAPQPQMRPVTKGEADRIRRYTFEEYERRYVLAIRTNDAAGAEAILGAVLHLLWELAKGYGKTRQAARHERVAEWEEFDTAVNEALNRARTLQTHIRHLSREELRSLRDAPTPTALRNTIVGLASRVTTRTVPPARRGRK